MVELGLSVRLEAKAGHETDVENVLREALPLATALGITLSEQDAGGDDDSDR